MQYLPYQLVSRISEPSTVWIIISSSLASWPAPFHQPISWIILSFSLMAASSSAYTVFWIKPHRFDKYQTRNLFGSINKNGNKNNIKQLFFGDSLLPLYYDGHHSCVFFLRFLVSTKDFCTPNHEADSWADSWDSDSGLANFETTHLNQKPVDSIGWCSIFFFFGFKCQL